jgi:hypothetical protein
MATYHPGGTRVKAEYQLHLYERNVQLINLRYRYGLFTAIFCGELLLFCAKPIT